MQSGAVQARFFVSSHGYLPMGEERYHDLIRLPVPEDYHQLTAKTLAFIKWFNINSDADYVMKLDDDSYPHLDRLLHQLKQTVYPLVYLGIQSNGPVKRTGKYAERYYEEDHYPPYMQGAGYIMSKKLAKEIMNRGHAHLDNENTTVGLRVREVENASSGIVRTSLRGTLYGCREQDVISMNWDARRFPCVFEKEKALAEKEFPCPVAGQCCGEHTHRHWSESASEDAIDAESETDGEAEGDTDGDTQGDTEFKTKSKD